MIRVKICWRLNQQSMHSHRMSLAIILQHVRFGVTARKVPVVILQKRYIRSINDCDLTLRQWD